MLGAPLRVHGGPTGLPYKVLIRPAERHPNGFRLVVVVLNFLAPVARQMMVYVALQDKDPEVVAQGLLLCAVPGLSQAQQALASNGSYCNVAIAASLWVGPLAGPYMTVVLDTEVRAGHRVAGLLHFVGMVVRMRMRDSWSSGPVHAWGIRDFSLVGRVTCIRNHADEEDVDLSTILQIRPS